MSRIDGRLVPDETSAEKDRRRTRWWLWAGSSLLAVAVTSALVSVSAQADPSTAVQSTTSVAAMAIPIATGTTASNDVRRYQRNDGRIAQANTGAVVSLTCNRCRGEAIALQVIYGRGATQLIADNVASASSSSCTGCTGSALSIQVVVVRSTSHVTAANRAATVNVACVECSLSAAALQFVIVAPSGRELDWRAVQGFESLLARVQDGLPTTTPRLATPNPAAGQKAHALTATPEPPIAETVLQMQSALSAALGATSATHDIQVKSD